MAAVRAKPYPKYKPSGVEWLGDVPAHWEVKRLKYSASINDEALPETTDPTSEMLYVDISSVDAVQGIVSCEEMVFEDAPSRARRVVRDGDTIISTVRTYLRAIAPVGNPKSGTIVSTGFAVVRPRRVDPAFMSYTLREPGFVEAIVARSVGVSYPAVNASDIATLPIPLPTEDEERAIADFLDRETAKIDALVTKKRTVIERLKEKRTALISRTVTRGLPADAARAAGLDPHPKLKPSGIAGIGEVPVHWEVTRLMYTTEQARPIMYGIVLPGPDVEDGVPIVKGGDVKPGRLTLESLSRTTPEIEGGYVRSRLKAGDVVFSIRGTVGEAELVPEEIAGANLTQDAARLAPGSRTSGRWLLYVAKAKAIVDPLLSLSLGAAVRGVNIRDLKRTPILLPPADEQRAIVEWLDKQTTLLSDMMTKVEVAIQRLQEYRAALITAAVTGKIDVRKAA